MSTPKEPLHGRAADEVRDQLREHPAPLPEITGPVREYLNTILDALTLPAAAREERAFQQLLDDRVSGVTASLRGLLRDSSTEDGDVTFDVGYLRRRILLSPATYEVRQAPEAKGEGE